MPRYRVNARFGPWAPGDEFESEDEAHAELAADGRFLVEAKAPEKKAAAEPAKPAKEPEAGQ